MHTFKILIIKSLGGGDPLSHKQEGFMYQLGVYLGCDLEIILVLLLHNIFSRSSDEWSVMCPKEIMILMPLRGDNG